MAAISTGPVLHVLGGFELSVAGARAALTIDARRVLALLAVSNGAQRRESMAGQLWPWIAREQARAHLRTALWRIRKIHEGLVHTDRDEVRLGAGVRVDLHESNALARALLHPGEEQSTQISTEPFASDLLPGWDEDWLQLERERHHQLRIHALEALSRQLTSMGHYASAIDAAYRAIAAAPLRESAYGALIQAHVAEGNRAEATHQLGVYRRLLADELGLLPSKELQSLLLTG
jgi:DNA-binding SARP family transcriptional activator